MIEPSGALLVQDVRPDDEGVYSCRAENLLGSVTASAKLTVQCKLLVYFSVSFFSKAPFLLKLWFLTQDFLLPLLVMWI